MRNDTKIEFWPVGKLKPYSETPRTHSRGSLFKLRNSIEALGLRAPLLITPDGIVIDGHARLDVSKGLGFDAVPCIVVRGLTDPQTRALRLAVNRLPKDAREDPAKLHNEIVALVDKIDIGLTGYDSIEVDQILSIDEPSAALVDEEAPAKAGPPVSQVGDIWVCDRHRLMCGDARFGSPLLALTSGDRAQAAFIDPPYNVAIEGHASTMSGGRYREFAMAAGEMSAAAFEEFLRSSMEALKPVLEPGSVVFACMDWRHLVELLNAGGQAGLGLLNLAVWTKPTPGLGSFYRSQHELIAVFCDAPSPRQNNVARGKYGRTRSNVWPYRGMASFGAGRDELLALHPTVKPVALVADAIRDVTKRGQIVLDTFLGSGTTMVAAEETGRRCFGCELDPLYVDVAVRRWQANFGKTATHVETGEEFEARGERLAAEQSTLEESEVGGREGFEQKGQAEEEAEDV